MRKVLITGGAGFFGELLKHRLLDQGFDCVSIDLQPDLTVHPRLQAIQGDIRDQSVLDRLFAGHAFEAVFHCAAVLAHAVKDEQFLWTSNVDGTRNICEAAKKHQVPRIIFTSTNCLWADEFPRAVTEEDEPKPIEIYGRSKAEAEQILIQYRDQIHAIIIRTPTIIDAGRLGLLAILFEFIREGRKVWVVGKGENRYQFIYAQDLADACILALGHNQTDIFNVGSDNVKSLKAVYDYVIERAATGARTASLPRGLTLFGMQLMHHLGLSPLGPYHYRMIAKNFIFDTSKIKSKLGWQPTLTNEEILYKAYRYYADHYDEIQKRSDVSAHKQAAKLGAIKLLKSLS